MLNRPIGSALPALRCSALPAGAGLLIESEGAAPFDALPKAQVEEWLQQYGALILRGFRSGTAEFLDFSQKFSPKFSRYEGGGLQWKSLSRERVRDDDTLLTTTGGDFGFYIPLHAEMHYTGHPPRLLWFFCEEAPDDRGETLLADSRAMFDALRPKTRAYFLENPVRYCRRYKDGEWQASFQTSDLSQLESLCKQQKCELLPDTDGAISIDYNISAVRQDDAGRNGFVNNVLVISYFAQALEAGLAEQFMPDLKKQTSPVQVRLQSGSRIPAAILQELADVARQVAVPHRWRTGDVAVIDNFRMLHGRNESTDRVRRIYTRLGY